MPGPLTLPPLPDLGAILRQSRHGIYNAQGVKVGSYDTLDAACQGQWFVFTGKTQPPPSQLYVNDFWGRRVPLQTQCVRSAKATAAGGSILHPQPVQPTSAVKAVVAANTAAVGEPAPVIDLDAISGALAIDPTGAPDAARTMNYAILGAMGLVGLALLLTPGSSRR